MDTPTRLDRWRLGTSELIDEIERLERTVSHQVDTIYNLLQRCYRVEEENERLRAEVAALADLRGGYGAWVAGTGEQG
jgi:regulator of replication initiation timing